MDRKKIGLYIVLFILIIAVSMGLPYAINMASDAVVASILKQYDSGSEIEDETSVQTETEEETENIVSQGTVSVTGYEPESDASVIDKTPTSTANTETATADIVEQQTQVDSESKTEEEDIVQSKRLNDMAAYAEEFSPEIIYAETAGTAESDFIAGREEHFLNTVGEYLYSLYDDWVTVVQIEIIEETQNDDDLCSCRIIMHTDDGNYEEFLCSYNKKYDFYGIYTVDSSETEVN